MIFWDLIFGFWKRLRFIMGLELARRSFRLKLKKIWGRVSIVVLCPFAGLKRDWLARRLQVDPVTGESAPMT